MSTLILLVRVILATICTLTCLLAWSYPDTFLPQPAVSFYGAPEPDLFDKGGFFSQNALWLLALLALYVVSFAGSKKNVVWFTAWFMTLIAGAIAWPLLRVWFPELLWPMLDYEDGKLSMGLFYAGIFVASSVMLRLGLLAFLFSKPLPPYEGNEVELHQLDVEKGRTVREIAAAQGRMRASFLFGSADENLVARFYGRMREMLAARRAKWLLISSLLTLLAMWFAIYPGMMDTPAHAQQRDRERMYQLLTRGSMLSTTPALYAAYRVLAPIAKLDRLRGMTIEQAEHYLGLDRLPAAQRAHLRDGSARESSSTEASTLGRLRFLTFDDGKRRVMLYLRFAKDGKTINFSELEEEGWDLNRDAERRRLSGEWRSSAISG